MDAGCSQQKKKLPKVILGNERKIEDRNGVKDIDEGETVADELGDLSTEPLFNFFPSPEANQYFLVFPPMTVTSRGSGRAVGRSLGGSVGRTDGRSFGLTD